MFPGPRELRLICHSIESIWTPKSKSSTSIPKTNLSTSSSKEISHVTSGIICRVCPTISHFSSAICSDAVAKRLQQDSGEVSFIARVPSNISSSTSVSPGKRSYGNQNPWRAKAVREERTGQPVVGSDQKTAPDYYHEQSIESSFSARFSKCDENQVWLVFSRVDN